MMNRVADMASLVRIYFTSMARPRDGTVATPAPNQADQKRNRRACSTLRRSLRDGNARRVSRKPRLACLHVGSRDFAVLVECRAFHTRSA